MRIEQSVEVDAPVKQVWEFVSDVPRVAPCMPGAKLTKVVDDRTYEGTVVVKLGPIRMTYKGTVVVEDMDDASHSAKMSASGRDVKGAGTARAQVEARLEPVSDQVTRIQVASDVQLTGKVASFGRGAVQDVANRLFGQFAECLRDTLHAEPAAGTGDAPAEAAAASGGAPVAEPSGPPPATSETAKEETAGSPASAQPAAGQGPATERPGTSKPMTPPPSATTPAPTTATRPTTAEPKPVDAGSLVGTVLAGRARAFAESVSAFARGLRVRLRERR